MTKLQTHASALDSFLSTMYRFSIFAAILVGIGFPVLYILYFFSPELLPNGPIALHFGFIKFTVDSGIAHNPQVFLSRLAALSLFLLAYMIIWILILRCGRKILAPMVEGHPFHSEMSCQLKKLGQLSIALGIADNVGMYVRFGNHIPGFDLDALFNTPGILQYSTEYTWNLSFVYWSAILFLLSYVFAHGWELQQLSDETL